MVTALLDGGSCSAGDIGLVGPESLELALMPRFDLRCAGEPVRIGPCAEHLVAFLALRRSPVRREEVCATLWSDADCRHASGGLRTALWRLRGLGVVAASRTHLCLEPGVRVDVDLLRVNARSLLDESPSERRLVQISEALMAAEGGLLVDYADDWVVEERECVRQVWLHAMDQVGEWLLDAGRSAQALHVALTVCRAEPLRESARRLLVRVHAAQGNVAEAIHEYRRYARLLEAELGVRPSPAMGALVASCLPERRRPGARRRVIAVSA